MDRVLLLKELDVLKTYFEEVIDGASEDKEADLETMQILFNLKECVEDAIKYVKGDNHKWKYLNCLLRRRQKTK